MRLINLRIRRGLIKLIGSIPPKLLPTIVLLGTSRSPLLKLPVTLGNVLQSRMYPLERLALTLSYGPPNRLTVKVLGTTMPPTKLVAWATTDRIRPRCLTPIVLIVLSLLTPTV